MVDARPLWSEPVRLTCLSRHVTATASLVAWLRYVCVRHARRWQEASKPAEFAGGLSDQFKGDADCVPIIIRGIGPGVDVVYMLRTQNSA